MSALSRGSSGHDSSRFIDVMARLSACPEGWAGDAGDAFVDLMREILARKAQWVGAEVGACGVMVAPDDVASEAVLVVDGPPDVPMAENVARILAMDSPLGYVVSAVSANLSRSVLADRMGVDSRQVSSGSRPVVRFMELERDGESVAARHDFRSPWAPAEAEGSRRARMVRDAFSGVLIQRFRVAPDAVRAGLDVAGTAAVDGETGVGMTPATTRRRIGRFMEHSDALRPCLDRVQARAFAGLVFGTERHPEWSLLAECAVASSEKRAIRVSQWHSRTARMVAAPAGRSAVATGRQPALFGRSEGMAVAARMRA